METVLGVSMAPAAVRMVLVEGENADGATVEQDNFELADDDDGSGPLSGPEQVIAAIMGTREGAAEAGDQAVGAGMNGEEPGHRHCGGERDRDRAGLGHAQRDRAGEAPRPSA